MTSRLILAIASKGMVKYRVQLQVYFFTWTIFNCYRDLPPSSTLRNGLLGRF
jgi:hypothetical protein